jgi:phage host-nuclease inhibitor protein Gam
MARKRIASPQQVKDLDDANKALAEIGGLELQLEAIDGEASTEIGKIKERAAKAGEKARNRIKDLEAALALYAEYNKAELFSERKTLELSYGTIGFRESTKVSVKKATIELLQKLFNGRGVRIEKKVDKDELRNFSDEELAQVDAAKVTQDVFGYTVNRDEVNKNLLRAG